MGAVIFLDFDGPMIPRRAYFLPGNSHGGIVEHFDPVAGALINELLHLADAQLVISSTWAIRGRAKCEEALSRGGIDIRRLHDDWRTPRRFTSSRIHEINEWLEDHPDVGSWIAIDDEDLVELTPRFVKCTFENGFTWPEFLLACEALEVDWMSAR